MTGPRHRPTLEEVARHAGVSRATVSRVVNGQSRVSPDAQRAVERAVRQLGYVPNQAARSLVTQRSDTVALVVSEPETRVFSEPFFAGIVRGVSVALAAWSRQMVLLMPQTPSDEARAADYVRSGHADGAILLSLHERDPLPALLVEAGVPAVLGGRPPADVAISCVDADNVGGARLAVRHLLQQDRRVIATVTGPPDMAVAHDRAQGWAAALAEAGVDPAPDLRAPADFTIEGGRRATAALLEARPDVDGIFAASDLMAIGALRALHQAGRAVPDDVAVVGFDDAPLSAETDPPLTSVHQPLEEMGRELARVITQRIDQPDDSPVTIQLATHLVVRASA